MISIYHNPRCSKSRKTLALLEEMGYHPKVIDYLKTPPTVEELRDLLRKLEMQPRDLMRRQEAVYQQKQLNNLELNASALIQAMCEHPVLIERPIVVYGDQAIIGRPPEKVLEMVS